MIAFENGISLSAMDLCRNWHICGRPGSGRSGFLASMILDFLGRGVGLTLLDLWGETVNMVLQSIPEELAHRVRVIRLGDTQNPVPLGLWAGMDSAAIKDMIRGLSQMLCPEDPWQESCTVPDWETWFTALTETAVALFGKRASLDTVALLGSRTDLMAEAASIIERDHPETARTLRSFLGIRTRDYIRFRMWAEEPLRSILKVSHWNVCLGLGENVLHHGTTSDDSVTLIDLGAEATDLDAAEKMGGMLLLYLLHAARDRKTQRPHLVLLDDAERFPGTAVGGVLENGTRRNMGLILAGDRLAPELQQSAERHCWSYTALNQTLSGAAEAALRLGDPGYERRLCSLDAGKGYSILRCGGKMSEIVSTAAELPACRTGASFETQMEERSRRLLSEPWRATKPLSRERAAALILHAKDPAKFSRGESDTGWPEVKRDSWVEKWVYYRLTNKKLGEQDSDESVEIPHADPKNIECDLPDLMDDNLILMDDQIFDDEEW